MFRFSPLERACLEPLALLNRESRGPQESVDEMDHIAHGFSYDFQIQPSRYFQVILEIWKWGETSEAMRVRLRL